MLDKHLLDIESDLVHQSAVWSVDGKSYPCTESGGQVSEEQTDSGYEIISTNTIEFRAALFADQKPTRGDILKIGASTWRINSVNASSDGAAITCLCKAEAS